MRITAEDLFRLGHAEFRHSELLKGRKITGVSTDSRSINAGNIFFALRGENFDGAAYVQEAFEKGAAAAVVEAPAGVDRRGMMPMLVVENTVTALGELAHLYRMKFKIPVLAVGGSNGKTTTKEMLRKVLAVKYRTLATEGNFNNQVGVPYTLFRLQSQHEVAVVEIGSNHPGEIRSLCDILEPTHGLITNVGREHLEFFGSVDGVADEEGVLFDSIAARGQSVAIVNADDEYVVMKAKSVKRRVTFGFAGRNAAVRGKMTGMDERGCARFQFAGRKIKRPVPVQLHIPGQHQAANALAAAAVGLLFNIPGTAIARALESFRPASKRMELLHVGGVRIYNDTYNANPDSTIAAIRTLAAAKVTGKRIAVLADMRELGERGPEEHARVGLELARLGIDYLLTFGELAKHIHDAAKLPHSVHYEQKNVLAEYLKELVAPGDAVLVKGSRGTKMEDVVIFLEERLQPAAVAN